jgi:hypothetical protein
VTGLLVAVAAGQPARRRRHGPARRRRCGPARGARSPPPVAARHRSTGRGGSRARPAPGRARRWPTRRWRPATSRRPAPRRQRHRARRPVGAVGRAGGGGRRSGRGSRADYGTGRVPARRAEPADGQPQQWGMTSRQARRSGLVMGLDTRMIPGAVPACSSTRLTRDHHQPDKLALCRGPGSGGETRTANQVLTSDRRGRGEHEWRGLARRPWPWCIGRSSFGTSSRRPASTRSHCRPPPASWWRKHAGVGGDA